MRMLVQRAVDIPWADLEGLGSVGITAGASAPEALVEEILDAMGERFELTIETVTTATEDVTFKIPRVLQDSAA